MEINQETYHFYLLVYGGSSITRKFEEGIFPVEEECEKVVIEIEREYALMQKDLVQNPNRYMILNFSTALYLGNEDMSSLKRKFSKAIIISKTDAVSIYINFEKKSQFVYKYLVSQWLRLNKLV